MTNDDYEKLLDEINDELGDSTPKISKDILVELSLLSNDLRTSVEQFDQKSEESKKEVIEQVKALTPHVQGIQKKLSTLRDVRVKDKVTVEGKVLVKNFDDIKLPKPLSTVSVKEAKETNTLLSTIFEGIGKLFKQVSEGVQRVRIEAQRDPKKALPVVLTDKNFSRFVNPFSETVVSGTFGGGGSSGGSTTGTNFTGGVLTVGTTAQEIPYDVTTLSIFIQSDYDNTGDIWIGGENVDSTGGNAIVRLKYGDGYSIDLDSKDNSLYVVSSAEGQTVYQHALI